MPNWCQNRVTFSGDENQIDEIRNLFSNENPFQVMIPQPPEEELSGTENTPGWYSWRLNNWGTKWDIDPNEVSFEADDANYLQIEFCTAWSPADGICKFLRDKYEDVDVIWFYDEPGMQDAGYI